MKVRDCKPGSLKVSGDQNPGQWPILRPQVAASNKTGKPSTTLRPSFFGLEMSKLNHVLTHKNQKVSEQCWLLSVEFYIVLLK